jgi:hypothetical protein
VDEHRAAISYDLIRHDRRLVDLGTRRLSWADAVVILTMQPPEKSAVMRALYPEQYDLTATTYRLDKIAARLEALTVIAVQQQMLLGNQSEIRPEKLPTSFDQLFEEAKPTLPELSDEDMLAAFAEIDARMGW